MSIGVCLRYRDPAREEFYWPYLTQSHLRDCLWPLAGSLGLWRVELLEVLSDYQSAETVRALLAELEVVVRHLDGTEEIRARYPNWEHVRNRTEELTGYLREVLTTWNDVAEVAFF